MSTPRELFSKVLRPVKTEPDASPAPAPPIVHDTITRHKVNEDGSLTVYEFVPGKGESERTVSPEEARFESAPADLTSAQREGARVVAAFLERDE